jgi:predicted Zn-dependent peptidase
MLLIAWPLPRDPGVRAQIDAVARATFSTIDAEIAGSARGFVFGDGRAPMYGVLVEPGKGETAHDLVDKVKTALGHAPNVFARMWASNSLVERFNFELTKQSAIYKLFDEFADGDRRDSKLAAHLLAGREPDRALDGVFEGLRRLTPEDAADAVRRYFNVERATIVELSPASAEKYGRPAIAESPIHDQGLRRDPPDPALAKQPLAPVPPPGALRSRTLPNGMRVVLRSVATVPTIDIKLVFAVGSGDEAADRPGIARVAAHQLSWDMRYGNDFLQYVTAGGWHVLDVGLDHTTFEARGLDMNIDLLLAGLRRWVREGTYDGMPASKSGEHEPRLEEQFQAARFGNEHPYATIRRVAVTKEQVSAFRAAHFTPDNATLVIAGRFDPDLADRWIDYLFADWAGRAEPRRSQPAAPQPASLAKTADTTQSSVVIALPANTGTAATQRVAAEMLAAIAEDARHQLGASYTFESELDETRLATQYIVGGLVDSTRVTAVVQLLRDRIAELQRDDDARARAFVSARNRAVAKLSAPAANAAQLAAQVERDVALGRTLYSDPETAAAIRKLTIDDMAATLAGLDLTRAIVAMRGPEAEVRSAFELLGRTPTFVRDAPPAKDAVEDTTTRRETVSLGDVEDAITAQPAMPSLAFMVGAGYALGHLNTGLDASGPVVTADVLYRPDNKNGVGIHVATGQLTGGYKIQLSPVVHEVNVNPIDIMGVAQATAVDRVWGAAAIGLHLDRIDDMGVVWQKGLSFHLAGGVDVLKLHDQRIGPFLRVEGTLGTDLGYAEISFGVAYRR